jgi:GntR family transcriptional regulator / MocR family aminotransferase
MDQLISRTPLQTRRPHGNDDIWRSLFSGFGREGVSLQAGIRRTVVGAIEAQRLPWNAQMPSGRQLAKVLGVARNTVVLAYQQLVDEGFLESRERSGYFVAKHGTPKATRNTDAVDGMQWSDRFRLRATQQRNIIKPRDWLRYPYPFIYGQFDPGLFPTNHWRECARSALSVMEIQNWARDMIDGDDPELIDQIRLHILPRRGIWAASSEIMITMGAQQGLSLVAQLLTGPDSIIGVEDPGYPDARNIFSMLTHSIRPLPIDGEGLMITPDISACDILFTTLGHQCPTGVKMPAHRRQALLDVANRDDIVVIEDDYEADMLPDTDDNRALKSQDTHGRVIYLGSLSKTLAPGLRLGFVVAAEPVIRELRALRRLSIRHAPINNQRAAALFLSLGHYSTHISRITTAFALRSKRAKELLAASAPELAVLGNGRSSCLWVTGPLELDAGALATLAETRGVLIERGDVFFATPDAPRNTFRMGISSIPDNRIERGIDTLVACLRELDSESIAPGPR